MGGITHVEGAGRVGGLLRSARLRHGLTIEDVAASLRIRRVYLSAIEDGRWNELPGSTYALGFVRTYAQALGLDSEEMARRFRDERAGIDRRTELVFPAPPREGGTPVGALVLTGLGLAVSAYGAWYWLSGAMLRPMAEVPVPPALVSGIQPPAEAGASTTLPALAAGLPSLPGGQTAVAAALPTATGSAPSASLTGSNVSPSTYAPPPTLGGSTVGAGASQSIPNSILLLGRPSTAPTSPPEQSPSPVAGAAPPLDSGQANGLDGAPPRDATSPTGSWMPVPPQAPAIVPAVPDPAPAVPTGIEVATATFGAQGGEPSRILLRARADSWIQVRERNSGSILFNRILRPGETYAVPPRPGLLLTTGNAGGLDVVVEGQVLPPLGALAAVRRDVPLEIERLRAAGSAAGPAR